MLICHNVSIAKYNKMPAKLLLLQTLISSFHDTTKVFIGIYDIGTGEIHAFLILIMEHL